MISKEKYAEVKNQALKMFKAACIVLTPQEQQNLEIADFGLNDLDSTGLVLLTYINTRRVCAKELVLLPGQTCPEHYHPAIGNEPGKEETFRCRWGEVYLFVPSDPTQNPKGKPPVGDESHYTVFHEVILKPGEQYTLTPGIKHWFQAGPDGAIVSEFSTTSRDELDIFTDPRIVRTSETG